MNLWKCSANQNIHNVKTMSTNQQFKKLVQLSSKDIHRAIFKKQDTMVVVFIE